MEKLIIDCQLLQTNAWNRGMGNYLRQLIINTSKVLGKDTILLFNKNLETENILTIKKENPDAEILEEPLPTELKLSRKYKKCINTLIKKEGLEGSRYLISSLFSFDFNVNYPDSCFKLLLFYDLTPLLFWRDLGGYFPPELYMKRFIHVYEADRIFSISDTTKNDLCLTFGIKDNSVVNINGGYTQYKQKPSEVTSLINKRFLLFPTGDLPHKNNEFAIKAFFDFNLLYGESFNLVITSKFSEYNQFYLSQYTDKVVFVGNVDQAQLEWLYQNSEAVLMSSKYEGLGIPVLDALESNKPVIIPDIPVFKEMSSEAFYFYKSDNLPSLTEAIENSLKKEEFANKSKHYSKILNKYSWTVTTRTFLNSLPSEPNIRTAARKLKKIAIVSNHPGIEKSFGRISEPLFGYLFKDFSIDYYFDSCGFSTVELERPTFLDYLTNVYDIKSLNEYRLKKYSSIIIVVDKKESSANNLLGLLSNTESLIIVNSKPVEVKNNIIKGALVRNPSIVFDGRVLNLAESIKRVFGK